MPKGMPPEIAQFVEQHAPPGQTLIWMRCRLLKPPAPIERPPLVSQLLVGRKPPIPQDTLLELLDIDEGKGWDCRLKGVGHDIAPGDIFTALGHCIPGTNQIKEIAFLFNHKTGVFERAYSDISTASKLNNELKYKRSLSFWLPTNPVTFSSAVAYTLNGYYNSALTPQRDKLHNVIKTALAGGFLYFLDLLGPGGLGFWLAQQGYYHPWLWLLLVPLYTITGLIVGVALLLPFAVLGVFLWYLLVRFMHAIFEPPRFKGHVEYSFAELIGWDNLTQWLRFTRTDETYLYQDAGQMLHEWVKENPDVIRAKNGTETPVFVVGAMRGQGDKGVLPETPPA